MGRVYKAHDIRLGRTVALKFCNQQFTSRLEREARAIAALNHPHVCTLYDVLVYRVSAGARQQLTWYGRDGKITGTLSAREPYVTLSLSPDGSRVAVARPFSSARWGGIGVIDVVTGIATWPGREALCGDFERRWDG